MPAQAALKGAMRVSMLLHGGMSEKMSLTDARYHAFVGNFNE